MIRNTRTERYQREGLWFWAVYRDLVDDATGEVTKAVHVLPEDAITVRAAEYELDPTDPHLALDFILHEVMIENPPERPHLLTAPTVAEARAAHQADVDAVRARFGHGPMPRARAARDVHVAGIAAQVKIDPVAYHLARAQVGRRRADIMTKADALAQADVPPLVQRLLAAERKATQ